MILPPKNKITKEKAPEKKKLTVKQKKFVEALANPKTRSATEAALTAGYSPKSARFIAYENSTKPYISEQAQERVERAIRNMGATPEEVIGSASFQMRGSIDDVLDEHGSFDLQKARANGAIDLIKKMEITERPIIGTNEVERTYKIEMMPNEGARKELSDYLGVKQNPRENDFNLRSTLREILIAILFNENQRLKGVDVVKLTPEEAVQSFIEYQPEANRAKLIEAREMILEKVKGLADTVI